MFKRPKTDFWKVGIVPSRIQELTPERLGSLRDQVVWLPEAGPWRYHADPFGLLVGDSLHVFVELYDYRTKLGVIERHELSLPGLQWRSSQVVLSRPFHLSYPSVFQHAGEVFMLPESAKANEIALYRAVDASLDRWEKVCPLIENVAGVDASVIKHEGRWWMFYSILGRRGQDQRELHAAHAPSLTGPWSPLACNPIRVDLGGARPAGHPFHDDDGAVILPLQDSTQSYGSALRLCRLDSLEPSLVRFEPATLRLTGDMVSSDYTAGFHTASGCGPYTLIDVKRIDRSRMRQWLDLRRRVGRLLKAKA